MKLITGLGNPGLKYVWTRHNMGWMVIDNLVTHFKLGSPKNRFSGELWGPAFLGGEKVCFLKPLTYMNLSGKSVSSTARFYGIDLEDILIVYDDVALPFGHLRFRPKGSAGGHNGMKSILGELGTLELPRLRVGVGVKPPNMDLVSYVLGRFPGAEREALSEVLDRSARACEIWMGTGVQEAMNVINSQLARSAENRRMD